jgi:hypothetical protein
MAAIDFETTSPLDVEVMSRLDGLVAKHTSLENILVWSMAQSPPVCLEDMIQQDEFTNDLVIPFENNLFLVYDVT